VLKNLDGSEMDMQQQLIWVHRGRLTPSSFAVDILPMLYLPMQLAVLCNFCTSNALLFLQNGSHHTA
jgi:hypothetical protein